MPSSTKKQGFALYQTPQGIELHNLESKHPGAELICCCNHYHSALRIAKAAATHQKKKFTNHTLNQAFIGLSR